MLIIKVVAVVAVKEFIAAKIMFFSTDGIQAARVFHLLKAFN